MPTNYIAGFNNAGVALNVIDGNSRKETVFSRPKSLRYEIQAFIPIRTAPINSPGTIPAKNRLLIDVLETSAYSTIGIDGGIIGPMVAVAAVIAAA